MNRLLCFILFLLPMATYSNVDSVGTETIDGKRFIIHKVEKGEGLYGLARIYGTTFNNILQANNLTNTSLDIGQLVKIPAKAIVSPKVIAVEPVKESKKVIESNSNYPKVDKTQYITHVVGKGETLYQIAKKYGISVTEIREINNIKGTSISYRQKLKIAKKGVVIDNPDLIEPTEEEAKNVKVEVTKGTADVKVSTRENKYLQSTDFAETGIAGWINDKSINPKKSIALHKTAPIGTIIRVTNLMNNKSVYVKVIGTLPETGDNENTIIVVSKAAVNMLGAIDQKFRVNLNYSIPKE